MEIEEKYIKLLGKLVYNKRLDKYGRISSLELMSSIKLYMSFNVFYDTFDDKSLLLFSDIEKGEVQFVIWHSSEQTKGRYSEEVDDIKSALGDKFSDDMIIYMTDDEWRDQRWKNDAKNVQKLHTDLVPLTEISAEVMADDFHSRELYLKYKGGVLSKEEMLYALVNHLCQEYKRLWDTNSRYFFKYEFDKEVEKLINPEKTRGL